MNEAKTYISEKVKNASGVTINPAIKENQDTLNTLMESIHDLTKVIEYYTYHALPTHSLPYAKDTSDNLRVAGTLGIVPQFSNYGTVTPPYTTGAPMSSDSRDNEAYLSKIQMNQALQRWTY